MPHYLIELKLITESFKNIEASNLILHLENLNVEQKDIRSLKSDLLTTQSLIK